MLLHGLLPIASSPDHELEMKTMPVITNGSTSDDGQSIENLHEILQELQSNKACHGEGNLHASCGLINFQAAFDKAMKMQKEGAIPYGPFRADSSNCSRFVNTVIRAGKPDKNALQTTLFPPERSRSIPENAQWLSGEGAGSWFVFNPLRSHLEVTRYSPDGTMECRGLYKNTNGGSHIPDGSFRITYPSNCRIVSFKNGSSQMKFERVAD